MAWPGYFSFVGTEIINATRTEAYARNLNVGWFRPAYNEPGLNWVLQDPPYSSPLQDDAPWLDPNNLDSFDFYGVYPLDVTGIEDSTYEADITESTLDGGYVGKRRRKTRSVVFSAVLIGSSECAVMYGMHWLRVVLGGGPCFGKSFGNCAGGELCFFSCVPCICEGDTPDLCNLRYGHSLHNVTATKGPEITDKKYLRDGGTAWQVTWTMTAANPIEFGADRQVVAGFLDPHVVDPYVSDINGDFDQAGYVQTEPSCPVVAYTPVYDPTCPLLVPPPDVPSADVSCFDFPVNYLRRSFTIPRTIMPLWGDVVPILTLTTAGNEARNTRIRFYADLFGTNELVGQTDATNLAPNPSLEGGALTGWNNNSSTLYTTSLDTSAQVGGANSFRSVRRSGSASSAVSSATLVPGSSLAPGFPCTPGTRITASVDVKAVQANRKVTVTLKWLNSKNVQISTTPVVAISNTGISGTINRAVAGGVPPKGAISVQVDVTVTTLAGNAIVGESVWLDNLLVSVSQDASYFDGDTVETDEHLYQWTGDAYASTSVQIVKTYEVTTDIDAPLNDPCNFCGDLVVSYMPPSSTLVIDGTDRLVYMDAPGLGRRRADALVSDTNGEPFEWPELSCGFGYVVTVDTPQNAVVPIVDMSLVPRVG